jgi:hypothetical protein
MDARAGCAKLSISLERWIILSLHSQQLALAQEALTEALQVRLSRACMLIIHVSL